MRTDLISHTRDKRSALANLGWLTVTSLLIGLMWGCGPSREERISEIKALHVEGRYYEAISPSTQLFSEFPDDLEVNRLYGTGMLGSGLPGLAIWPLRFLAAHSESGAHEKLLLARALVQGGASIEGFAVTQELVAEYPETTEAVIFHATLALENQEYDELLSAADLLLETDSERRPRGHLWRAEALIGLERYEEADLAVETALNTLTLLSAYPEWSTNFCKTTVKVAKEQEDKTQTRERINSCLEQFPIDLELISEAVSFFDEVDEPESANAVLENAIAVAPQYLGFRTQLADRLLAEGDEAKAEALLVELTKNPATELRAWLALADIKRKRDDFHAAALATEKAFSLTESITNLQLSQLADDWILADELERAEALIEKIGEPKYAALLRGRVSLARNKPAQARAELLEGLKLFTGNATARYLAGQAAEQLGDLELAMQDYRSAVRSGPEKSEAPFALARLYEAEGNISEAYHMLNLRLIKTPDDEEALRSIAELSLKTLSSETAQQAIEDLAKLPGQKAAVASLEGRLALRDEGLEQAIKTLLAHELNLTLGVNAEVLRELVDYRIQLEQTEEALAEVRLAISAKPGFPPFHEILAVALSAADPNTNEAKEAWSHALTLDPKSTRAMIELAELAAENEKADEAIELYDRATEADPENTSAAWKAIVLLRDLKRDEELNERLERLITRDSIHRGALSMLARRLVTSGEDLDQAEALATRALRYARSSSAVETLGILFLERGENDRALRILRLAARKSTNSPSFRYHLGRALLANGQVDAARRAFKLALEVDDFAEAPEAREQLSRLPVEVKADAAPPTE